MDSSTLQYNAFPRAERLEDATARRDDRLYSAMHCRAFRDATARRDEQC
jgi:hypothetical protein